MIGKLERLNYGKNIGWKMNNNYRQQMVEFMRVLAGCGRLCLVKKAGSKLIGNSFEIPHETLP